jgi:endoglucanase
MRKQDALRLTLSSTLSISLALVSVACGGGAAGPGTTTTSGGGAGGGSATTSTGSNDGGGGAANTGSSGGGGGSSSSSTSSSSTSSSSTSSSSSSGSVVAGEWLHTQGNHIFRADGKVWHGRGANIQDTRGCGACAFAQPVVSEVNRRVDELADGWGANFMRLTLESYAQPNPGQVQWQNVVADPGYLADVVSIVHHATQKPGVYVLVSLWVDSTFSDLGWPTQSTREEWKVLAQTFKDEPHVLFGVINEPQLNFDGAQDPQVWSAMNDTVATIRAVEDAAGAPHHVVTVQGTGGWARRLDYYVTHPITAGGGDNVAYEVHVYNPASDFGMLFQQPSATLPVVIGEFGPTNMTEQECGALMVSAEALEIPYLAWTFHMRCPPNLLVDDSQNGCGVGMPLSPTSWGSLLKQRLAMPW